MYGHALSRGYAVHALVENRTREVLDFIDGDTASFLPQNYAKKLAALYHGI
jgi:hypothetical protein